MKYSQERKQAVLARLAPPHQRTIKDVAAEEDISPATPYHWRQQARLTGGLFLAAAADPEGWTKRDKFTAVMETAPLNESACPARSRRALSTAESGSAEFVESVGSIRNRSRPGEGSVSLGPVSVASSRPPWIVMHVRRCEHWNGNCSARRKRWPLRLRAGQANQHPRSPACGIAD